MSLTPAPQVAAPPSSCLLLFLLERRHSNAPVGCFVFCFFPDADSCHSRERGGGREASPLRRRPRLSLTLPHTKFISAVCRRRRVCKITRFIYSSFLCGFMFLFVLLVALALCSCFVLFFSRNDFKLTHTWFYSTPRYLTSNTSDCPQLVHIVNSHPHHPLLTHTYTHTHIPEYIYCISMATITSWKFMVTCNITRNKNKWHTGVFCLYLVKKHALLWSKAASCGMYYSFCIYWYYMRGCGCPCIPRIQDTLDHHVYRHLSVIYNPQFFNDWWEY